jgi:hypothetical protein
VEVGPRRHDGDWAPESGEGNHFGPRKVAGVFNDIWRLAATEHGARPLISASETVGPWVMSNMAGNRHSVTFP